VSIDGAGTRTWVCDLPRRIHAPKVEVDISLEAMQQDPLADQVMDDLVARFSTALLDGGSKTSDLIYASHSQSDAEDGAQQFRNLFSQLLSALSDRESHFQGRDWETDVRGLDVDVEKFSLQHPSPNHSMVNGAKTRVIDVGMRKRVEDLMLTARDVRTIESLVDLFDMARESVTDPRLPKGEAEKPIFYDLGKLTN
jgi:hypothetical protein